MAESFFWFAVVRLFLSFCKMVGILWSGGGELELELDPERAIYTLLAIAVAHKYIFG